MAFALNIVALLLVVGLSWGAMMWLSGRSHGHGSPAHEGRNQGRARAGRSSGDTSVYGDSESRCARCEGVGAHHRRGRLEPCPVCDGTGVDA